MAKKLSQSEIGTFFCTSMEQTFSTSCKILCIDGLTSSNKTNASCLKQIVHQLASKAEITTHKTYSHGQEMGNFKTLRT